MMRLAVCSTAGAVRHINEDSICAKIASSHIDQIGMAIVCDGVGGLSAGEIASASLVSCFSQWFEVHLGSYLVSHTVDKGQGREVLLDDLRQEWGSLLQSMNKAILVYGRKNGISLGTTITGLLACGRNCFIVQVADSRAYLLRDRILTQLTQDQTYVAREVARGHIDPKEVKHHSKRNVLLQAVGAQKLLTPAFQIIKLQKGDAILLCSDGFYNKLEDKEIIRTLGPACAMSEEKMHSALRCLTDIVISRGEKDNVSSVCLTGFVGDKGDDEVTKKFVIDGNEETTTMLKGTGNTDSLDTCDENAVEEGSVPRASSDAPTEIVLVEPQTCSEMDGAPTIYDAPKKV